MSGNYVLIDGAQLANVELPDAIARHPCLCRLYLDLGDEAAQVGPWLLPATFGVREVAQAWSHGEDLRFAVSFVQLPGNLGLPDLENHLQSLRYVAAWASAARPRHYLRYADTRTLSALWPVLDIPQRQRMLGPLLAWSWRGASGQDECAALHEPSQPGHAPGQTAAPLRLRPSQFKHLIEAGRIGELLGLALEYFPDLLEDTSLEQRWAGTRTAVHWLEGRLDDQLPIKLAAVAVTIRARAANLQQPEFASLLEQAITRRDPAALLDWRQDNRRIE